MTETPFPFIPLAWNFRN